MIYLDHNATTPLAPEVRQAMFEAMDLFGNPASVHEAGRLARNLLDEARRQVAALAGVHARNVIFTSGGTEANNLALRGVAARRGTGRILVSAVEHSAVLGPARDLAAAGVDVEFLPVDAAGQVAPSVVEARLGPDVILVSVMLANNETGVLQDVRAISALVRRAGAVMHTDAAQFAGKLPLDFGATGAHLLSLSAHKLYGPKGVGALITDGSIDLVPQISGGGQEAGWRSGTENLPGIAGFGAACALALRETESHAAYLAALRHRLETGLAARPNVVIFGQGAPRLPNTTQFALGGMTGETLQMGLDRQGIAVSTGSACHSRSTEPSHVLTAMGVESELARGAVRVSLGRGNTEKDVDALLKALDRLGSVLPVGAAAW